MTDWLLELHQRDKIGDGEPQRIHDAQYLLAGHNVFGHQWYRGLIDGIFGQATASAAKKCKWDLGYDEKAVLPSFGPEVRAYLLGDKLINAAMKKRRKERMTKFVWPTRPQGKLIGFPGVGTHSFSSPPNNWESDNAWDIYVPHGSPIVAVADGMIGPAFGSLGKGGRFAGLRCHLETADNEFYYAHLSSFATGLKPGLHVAQGQELGLSGEANGVTHLHIGMEHLVQINTFAFEK